MKRVRANTLNTVYADIGSVLFDKPRTMLHGFPAKKQLQVYSISQGILLIGGDTFHNCKNLQGIRTLEGVITIGEDTL